MNNDSKFQRELISYLESVQKGEFITGTMQDIKERVPHDEQCTFGIHSIIKNKNVKAEHEILYKDPTLTMPNPAPLACESCYELDEFCDLCVANDEWWKKFDLTVDDIILRSNVHRCATSTDSNAKSDSTFKKGKPTGPKGCLDQNGNCKARFPRDTYEVTLVNNDDGHIFMKKLQAMLNTFS